MGNSAVAPSARYGHFIGGASVGPVGDEWFEDCNPFDGTAFAEIAAGGREDAAAAVAAAAAAFPAWAETSPERKQRLFLDLADLVEKRRAEIIDLLTIESGATPGFAAGQLQRVVAEMRQAAGWVYQPSGEVIPSDTPGSFHMALRRPLGVVAGITPWNGPQIVGWRTVIPPLAFGNTVVIKPSELAPITAGLLIAEIAHEAGFPAGTVNVVTHGPGAAGPIADEFFENDAVRCINFTGSSRTGRLLAERAGRHLKRIVLELSGYNPLLVLRDADLDYAVDATAFAAFLHQGEVCLNARKAIVEEPVFDEFLRRLQAKAESMVVGDPGRPETAIGPLITPEALARVAGGVDDALKKGARAVTGGSPDAPCFPPTILTDVPADAEIYREEVFGPVLVVQSVADVETAIAVANDHRYGLAAGILTEDQGLGLEIAGRLESGIVHVNDQTMHDEAQMPVGGVRDSGWGRAGPHSVEDFTQLQWVSVQNGRRHFPL